MHSSCGSKIWGLKSGCHFRLEPVFGKQLRDGNVLMCIHPCRGTNCASYLFKEEFTRSNQRIRGSAPPEAAEPGMRLRKEDAQWSGKLFRPLGLRN